MGIFRMFSSCSDDLQVSSCHCSAHHPELTPTTGNPNPNHFEITKTEKVGRFLIAMIEYPDCQNFEGKKILVYEKISAKKLLKAESLDPHFCDCLSHPSPIARFVPTDQGWQYAISFCESV